MRVPNTLTDCKERKRIFHCLRKFLFLLSIPIFLGSCSSSAEDRIINGQWVTLKSKIGIRFDISADTYSLIPEESESLLVEDYILERSENIRVKEPRLSVSLEDVTENQGDSSISYQMYFINAKIDVMVPKGNSAQNHGVRLIFPTVLDVRDALGAFMPIQEPTITFRIQSFPSKNDLALEIWWKKSLYAIGLSLIAILAIASTEIDGCAFVAFGAVLVSMYFWFLTIRTLWYFSPMISITIGLAVIVGTVQLLRSASN